MDRKLSPQVALRIRWRGHHLLHDDPDAIYHWVDIINNKREKQEEAELLLGIVVNSTYIYMIFLWCI